MATEIRARRFLWTPRRVLVVLLMFAVPGLSTLAKINWYLPQSDPGHYVTTATKMKVAHAPAVKAGVLQSVPLCVVPTQPENAVFSVEWQETSIPRMLLTVILLHRSPPFESA